MWRGAQVIRPGTRRGRRAAAGRHDATWTVETISDHVDDVRGHVPRHAGRTGRARPRAARAGVRSMSRPVQVTVLGGGSWGTTVAVAGRAQHARRCCGRATPTSPREINERAHATRATSTTASCPRRCARRRDLEEAVGDADVLVVGVPSHGDPRRRSSRPRRTCAPWVPVLSLAKGLEPGRACARRRSSPRSCPATRSACSPGRTSRGEVLDGLAAAAVDRDPRRAPSPARCSRCSTPRASASTATRTCSAPSSAAC